MTVSEWIAYVDQRVWGPGMLVLLMGTPGETWAGR